MTILIRSDRTMTNPKPGTPFSTGKSLYGAGFGAPSDDLTTIATAALPGLKSRIWEGTSKALAVVDGRLVRGSNTTGVFQNALPAEGNGVWFTLQVMTMPAVSGNLYFDLFDTFGGLPDIDRVMIGNGYARLAQRVGGSTGYVGAQIPITDGTKVAIRWVAGAVSLIVNGVEETVAPSVRSTLTTYVGISGSSAATGFSFDNLSVQHY